MTTTKLLSEVSALGFEDTLDLNDKFIHFANLAHTSISVEFGEARRLSISRASIAEAAIGDDGHFITADLSLLAKDFMMPIGMPETKNGVMIPGAFVSGTAITLPSGFEGDVFLRFRQLAVGAGEAHCPRYLCAVGKTCSRCGDRLEHLSFGHGVGIEFGNGSGYLMITESQKSISLTHSDQIFQGVRLCSLADTQVNGTKAIPSV